MTRPLSAASSALPQPIALVHEWFTPRSLGGSEQVARELDALLAGAGSMPDLFALVDGESRRAHSGGGGGRRTTDRLNQRPW
ncbi:MAG: glycosyltransferase family 4 protein, partial [Vulcanococcus sp.]